MEYSEKCHYPSWLNWGIVKELPRLVCTVKIRGITKGYVAVLFDDNQYNDYHVTITHLISQAVELELSKQALPNVKNYPTIITAFIADLFQGVVKNRAMLASWERSLHGKLLPPFQVAVIEGDNRVSTTLHYLQGLLADKSIYGLVLDGKLNILYMQANTQITFPDLLHNLNIIDSFDIYGLALGMSDLFEDLLDIGNYKYQAERALCLGKRYNPTSKLHSYQDFILENMMTYFQESEKISNYMHPSIPLLDAYDKKNGTEYLLTLNQYLKSMCNSSQTAEHMHIHRNTLHYRLKRIEEIAEISLQDAKLCALLLNNFYLLDVIQ